MLKNQEKQLELMMQNHSIIDDEEFLDCSMDFGDDRGDHMKIMPIDNGRENWNKVENGNYRKEVSPPTISPVKKAVSYLFMLIFALAYGWFRKP